LPHKASCCIVALGVLTIFTVISSNRLKADSQPPWNAQVNPSEGRAAAETSRPASAGDNGVAALSEAGHRHLQAGRYLDAQVCCQQALALDAGHADSLHLMGLLCLEQGLHEVAVAWIARAIQQSPEARYLSSLGIALHRQGRHDEAVKALDTAVQLKPADAAIWANFGIVLEAIERPSDALSCFQRTLLLDPCHLAASFRSAVLLGQLGRLEEALAHFNLCDELQPDDFPTLASRSLVLRSLNRFEDYLADGRRAYALDPASVETCNNVGDALLLLGRFAEALEWFDRALELRPSFALALDNKAVTLRRMHRFDEALTVYHQISAIDPASAKAEFDRANLNLLLGNFETGWREREARLRVPLLPIVLWKGPEPVWLGGEGIDQKTILIYCDEGLGDTIQFSRYAPLLAERGARVVLVVQDALHSLLSGLPGLSHCFPASAKTLVPVEVYCPLTSLPLAFRTTLDTIPPPIRLSPPVDLARAWEERLGRRDRLRVGLAWSGSPTHANDHNRSMPLKLLTRLLDVDATFLSLQRDPRPDDKAVLAERADIVELTAHLTDFSETAALVSCLDLVITVDTSVAHLAGAMGCPTWIMLPHTPDYRWLLNREDSPWYPSVRLFRQTSAGDFAGVIERVRAELSRLG
jgi:tetratricopeptide (TPR) repeat protein